MPRFSCHSFEWHEGWLLFPYEIRALLIMETFLSVTSFLRLLWSILENFVILSGLKFRKWWTRKKKGSLARPRLPRPRHLDPVRRQLLLVLLRLPRLQGSFSHVRKFRYMLAPFLLLWLSLNFSLAVECNVFFKAKLAIVTQCGTTQIWLFLVEFLWASE